MNANQPIKTGQTSGERNTLDNLFASAEMLQHRTLMRILDQQKGSDFGVEHGFDGISSVEAFRKAVPLSGAWHARARIDLQMGTQRPLLTGDLPVAYLPAAQPGHHVPVTAAELATRRRFAEAMTEDLDAQTGAFSGHVIDLAPLDRSFPAQHTPLGYRCDGTDKLALNAVEDMELKAYLTAMTGLSRGDVSAIHAPDLVSIGLFRDVIRRHWSALLADLENNTLSVGNRIGEDLECQVRMHSEVSAARLQVLRKLTPGQGPVALEELWPGLRVILTDDSRNRQGLSATVQRELPSQIAVIDVGCWLNEAMLTLPNEIGGGNAGVPMARHTFLEFMGPRTDDMLGLHQIGEGIAYRVYVTTASGLYRHALPVIAEVVGWSGQIPLLTIKRVVDPAAGYPASGPDQRQITAAARDALDDSGAGSAFCKVTRRTDTGRYNLTISAPRATAGLLERITALFERNLRSRSLFYDRKRSEGAPSDVDVVILRPGLVDA